MRTIDERALLIAVGKRVVELRKNRGLTQIQLSYDLDIEDSALRRIEKGRTNITMLTLKKLVETLKVSYEDFFSRVIVEKNNNLGA